MDALNPVIEAALLAASQPLSRDRLASLFAADGEPPTTAQVNAAIEDLRAACEGRGVELVEVASGYRYQIRENVHARVARLWAERPPHYSRALLETLALIAYRQPVTRGEIEQVRGVAVSTGIIRTLEEREWIRVVGYRDAPGKPALYGSTRQFLDYFNLKSLDELPALAEVRDMESFEPQFDFDPPAPAAAANDEVPVSDDDDFRAESATVTAAVPADADEDDRPDTPTQADDTPQDNDMTMSQPAEPSDAATRA